MISMDLIMSSHFEAMPESETVDCGGILAEKIKIGDLFLYRYSTFVKCVCVVTENDGNRISVYLFENRSATKTRSHSIREIRDYDLLTEFVGVI